jgi:hypothetical protein
LKEVDADQELVEFLQGQGHSEERAIQIASNHPDAVRADIAKAKQSEAPKKSKADSK